MRVIILAGGLGTRLAEETGTRPKPMVEIGGKPILWHIMNIYGAHGHSDFYVACGYLGHIIKEYFTNFVAHESDFRVDLSTGETTQLSPARYDWKIAAVDTGHDSLTGQRIKRLAPYVKDETFMVTYGDGVGNVDVTALLEFHRSHGKLATLTAVHPPARFGSLELAGGKVERFIEKSQMREGWINGGFFVFEPEVLDYIEGNVALEHDPLERLAAEGQLMAFTHADFWQPMDTLREKQLLEQMWAEGDAPWKVW